MSYDKLPTMLINTSGVRTKKKTITLADGTTRILGKINWSASPAGRTVALDAASKWMANWNDYSTNTNGRCVSYFLDEIYWTNFRNTTETYATYIEGVIGTPTVEMFVASWNAKREATIDTTDKIELALMPNGTVGYNINGSSSVNIPTTDNLYTWSIVYGSTIWLASRWRCT